MTAKNAAWWLLGMTVGLLLVSLALYPILPALIPIHWGLDGRPDGWAPKHWAAFMGVGMVLAVTVLHRVLPAISPRQFSMESFQETYHYLMALIGALMSYLHLASLAAALIPGLDSGKVVICGIMVFFALLGNVLGRTRKNMWMGVRTPWTLASDEVWQRTHRLAGRLMVGAGLMGALLALIGIPQVALVLLMVSIFWPVIYSLVIYRRLEG